jgi:hypothetical protein
MHTESNIQVGYNNRKPISGKNHIIFPSNQNITGYDGLVGGSYKDPNPDQLDPEASKKKQLDDQNKIIKSSVFESSGTSVISKEQAVSRAISNISQFDLF